MVKIILNLYCLFILSVTVFAQNEISIFVQTEDFKPLEDVTVFNKKTKYFCYTNEKGMASFNYKTELDSFKISIPSFEEQTYTIEQIKKLNNNIFLKEKPLLLDEVLVVSEKPKSNVFFKLKTKKKRFFEFTSPGGSIVSPYVHKKQKSNNLSSISLFFDQTKLQTDSDIKIRLLIFKDDNKWVPIIESTTTFSLSDYQSEINISFQNNAIELVEGQKYLIGFELLNKDKINSVFVLSTSLKNSLSYFRAMPHNKFVELEKDEPSFSLYYEIYFDK